MTLQQLKELKDKRTEEYTADIAALDRVMTMLSTTIEDVNPPTTPVQVRRGPSGGKSLMGLSIASLASVPTEFTTKDLSDMLLINNPGLSIVNSKGLSTVVDRMKKKGLITLVKPGSGRERSVYRKV